MKFHMKPTGPEHEGYACVYEKAAQGVSGTRRRRESFHAQKLSTVIEVPSRANCSYTIL